MSAFCDIWFDSKSGNKPKFVREGNSDWDKSFFDKVTYWQSKPLGEDKYPFITEVDEGDFRIILLGQLYEELSTEALLKRCVNYIDHNKKFDDPAGHYILFLINKRTEQLHVFTNRFGTYQAYYLSENGGNTIATPYINLAKQASNKDLDWEGVTSFLAQGYFANDNTFLKSIKILEPASYYLFDSQFQKKKNERYWHWEHRPVNKSINERIEEVHQVLSKSIIAATKNQKVALPISGGLDSRTLVGLLTSDARDYQSLWSYSYGYTNNSIETRISQKLAKLRGISFDGYKLPNYLFDNTDVISESVDLFQCIDGTRQASMVNILKDKSSVVVGGHWGDVWFDNMGINRENELLPYYQKKIIKKGSKWLLENICKEHLSKPEELLNDNFNSFMSKYKEIEDVDFRMKIYKTDQWSFRWTLPSIRMYQAGSMPVLPFYDKNVTDVLTNVPTKELENRSFQIEYIKAKFPDLAKVRWQEYGTNLYLYKKINNRNLIYRGLKKGQRILTPRKHIVRNWELFYLNKKGKENLQNILLDDKLRDVFPLRKVDTLLKSFYSNPNSANGYTVSMLHTLTQLLKRVYE